VAASPCATVLTLPTGHSPFFAAPERLAAQLDLLTREPRGNAWRGGLESGRQ